MSRSSPRSSAPAFFTDPGPARRATEPKRARGAGAAPHSPRGVAPTVGAAATAPVEARQCPPPPAIAAALTVFDDQAVFRAVVRGAADRVLLLRFRRGSRAVLPRQVES